MIREATSADHSYLTECARKLMAYHVEFDHFYRAPEAVDETLDEFVTDCALTHVTVDDIAALTTERGCVSHLRTFELKENLLITE